MFRISGKRKEEESGFSAFLNPERCSSELGRGNVLFVKKGWKVYGGCSEEKDRNGSVS
jgi:hypothetical protein